MTKATEKSDVMKNANSAATKTASWSPAKKEFADRIISSSADVRASSSQVRRDRYSTPRSSQASEK